MSQFEIIDDLDLPEIKRVMTPREKGPFAKALDSLEIGQGFRFTDKRVLGKLYPSVSPKRFNGKSFTLRFLGETVQGEDGKPAQVPNEGGEFEYGVKRKS